MEQFYINVKGNAIFSLMQTNYVNIASDCGTLTVPVNGGITLSGGTVYGSLATIQCNVGYSLVGSATRRCSEIGQWEPQVSSQCKIKGSLIEWYFMVYTFYLTDNVEDCQLAKFLGKLSGRFHFSCHAVFEFKAVTSVTEEITLFQTLLVALLTCLLACLIFRKKGKGIMITVSSTLSVS